MNKISGVLKFILGILLLPCVIAVTVNFSGQLLLLDKITISFFLWGIISYLILHLFIYEPASIYKKGQRLLEIIFRFFAPLVKVATYVLPIYTLIIFGLYFLAGLFLKNTDTLNYFVFLFSLSMSFHLIFTASVLRKKEKDFLRANYLFGFSFIYILNIIMLAFMFNMVFEDFSFINFFNGSYQFVKDIYAAIFGQLFIPHGQ